MRSRTFRTIVLLLSASACSGGDAPSPAKKEPRAQTAAPKPEVAAPKPPLQLFDAEGRLKGSGRRVAWLELPLGFEQDPASRAMHHVFVGRGMTLQQTRDYLSERMLTGEVDDSGEVVRYRAVVPISGGADAMRFDVSVARVEGGQAVKLTLDERTFLGADPLSVPEAREALKREQARAE
jgi:hypothetical protein